MSQFRPKRDPKIRPPLRASIRKVKEDWPKTRPPTADELLLMGTTGRRWRRGKHLESARWQRRRVRAHIRKLRAQERARSLENK